MVAINNLVENCGSHCQGLCQPVHPTKSIFEHSTGRWLARNNAYSFASLVLRAYKNLSLIASDGSCMDTLGLVSDMFEKPWFE